MGSIRGRYEWDDDSLEPGQRKDGGLHQNLFDEDGNLRAHARFVPDDNDDPGPIYVTETVYLTAEDREDERARQERAEFIAEVLSQLITIGVHAARPHVQRWLNDTARPAIAARRAAMRQRWELRKRRRTEPDDSVLVTAEAVMESDPDGLEIRAPEGPAMSQAEAQARLLAAAAAQAFSDQQVNLVANARILDDVTVQEIQQQIAALPREKLEQLLAAMVSDPRLLTEENLAGLASLLGRREL